MTPDWAPSFLDEMSKIAVALNKKERRRQALEFGALGVLSGPAIGAVSNIIQKGKPVPEGVKPSRWLLGSMAAGALISGAIPTIRHSLERNIQADASARARKAKLRAEKRLASRAK